MEEDGFEPPVPLGSNTSVSTGFASWRGGRSLFRKAPLLGGDRQFESVFLHRRVRPHACTAICLSCLLETGRYGDLIELLASARMRWWHWHRFGAEALARQGEWDAAIAYADGCRSPQGNDDRWIDRLRGRVDQGTLGGAGVGLARVRLRMSAAKNSRKRMPARSPRPRT